MSSKSADGKNIVTALRVEMRRSIQLLGSGTWSRKAMYAKAAKLAGITPRMARALFNWEQSASNGDRDFGAQNILAVREATQRIEAEKRAKAISEQKQAARDELAELRATVARLEARISRFDHIDPDFFSPMADADREILRAMDGTSRPVDRA